MLLAQQLDDAYTTHNSRKHNYDMYEYIRKYKSVRGGGGASGDYVRYTELRSSSASARSGLATCKRKTRKPKALPVPSFLLSSPDTFGYVANNESSSCV